MKPLTKSFLQIFLLFFISMPMYSQNVCSSLFAFLEKEGVHPQVQLLTADGTNNLPYNIIVNFTPEDTKSDHNLILLFDLEQGYTWRETISSVFQELQQRNYKTSVVFCYGCRINLPRDNIIYGSEVFAQSINSDGSNDVFIFNLEAEKNAIIPGSNRNHSPSWMLKDMFDAFSAAKMTDGLPVFYISQVAEYTFSKNKTLLSFLELDIPCISADIKESEKTGEILKSCIKTFETSSSKPYDSHSFMIRIFGNRIWFSEFGIINAIIVIIIVCLLFIFKTKRW